LKHWAKDFYLSKEWRHCRYSFLLSEFFVCNRCGGTAGIAHHKIHLTSSNICNADITMSYDNLEALCYECHAKEHNSSKEEVTAEGLEFNAYGELERKIE